ncbi:hypothetical protein ACO0SA_002280 [Hanseniaspora valbyensis]
MLSNTLYLSAAALLASLAISKADSQEFSLISIRSGSVLQYASVVLNVDGATDGYYPVRVGGKSYDDYVVDDEGRLVANGTYYWGLIPDTDGQYGATTDSANAITGFSIKDGNLASADGYAFVAVPDGTAWDLYSENADGTNGNTNNNLGLALAAYTTSGFASDFDPSESSDSTTTATTTTSTSASETTTSAAETTTVAPADNSTSTTAAYYNSTTVSTSATATSSAANITNTVTSENNAVAAFGKGSFSLMAMGLAGLFL